MTSIPSQATRPRGLLLFPPSQPCLHLDAQPLRVPSQPCPAPTPAGERRESSQVGDSTRRRRAKRRKRVPRRLSRSHPTHAVTGYLSSQPAPSAEAHFPRQPLFRGSSSYYAAPWVCVCCPDLRRPRAAARSSARSNEEEQKANACGLAYSAREPFQQPKSHRDGLL